MLIIMIIIIPVFVLYAWWRIETNKYKSLDIIPGPKPLPILGNLFDIGQTPQAILKNTLNIQKIYGSIFKLSIGTEVRVFITDPELIKEVLTSKEHISKSNVYNLLEPWIGTGLLTSTGDKWHIRRKLITPTFHFQILNEFIETFNSCGDVLVRKLSNTTGIINIYPFLNLLSLDVICETAMGVKMNVQEGFNIEYVKAVYNFLYAIIRRNFSIWKRFEFLYWLSSEYKTYIKSLEILHKFSNSIIQQRKEEKLMKNSTKTIRKKTALIDMLLEQQEENLLTINDIREEIDTFMFEGHDTVTSGLAFIILCLAENPEIQEKVLEEINSVTGPDKNSSFTFEQLSNLKYLEIVIKESLRLYPPVPAYERRIKRNCTIGGYNIPKNTILSVYPFALHRDERYFLEPNRFNPDRFLSGNQEERNTFAYVPFSAGPRNCIGQRFAMLEMKTILGKILKSYRIVAVPHFEPELGLVAVLKSYNGIMVQLEKRRYFVNTCGVSYLPNTLRSLLSSFFLCQETTFTAPEYPELVWQYVMPELFLRRIEILAVKTESNKKLELFAADISYSRFQTNLILKMKNYAIPKLSMASVFGGATLSLVLWWYGIIWKRYYLARNIPGPLPIPVIGNIWNVGSTPEAIMRNLIRLSEKYGGKFKLYIGTELRVFISDRNDIVTNQTKNLFISERTGYEMFEPWIGQGLLTCTNEISRNRRRILSGVFDSTRWEHSVRLCHNYGDNFLDILENQENPVEITTFVHRLSLDIVNETLLGVIFNSQEGQNLDVANAVQDFIQIARKRTFSSWTRIDFLFRLFSKDYRKHKTSLEILHTYTDTLIENARNNYFHPEPNENRILNLVEMLLTAENRNEIDAKGIKDEVNTCLLAGHDLIATLISFTLLSLAKNLDVQERIYREIVNVDGSSRTTNICGGNIARLLYLTNTIKETQRYYPTVPARESVLTDEGFIGTDIPKSTVVTVLIPVLHQNPQIFSEPEVFDPTRFNGRQDYEYRYNGTFFPFGVGSRCCIAQHFALLIVKTILIKVVKAFRILPVADFQPILEMGPSLRSANGIWMQFKRRP